MALTQDEAEFVLKGIIVRRAKEVADNHAALF